jgi:methionyl-tRNA synthetase
MLICGYCGELQDDFFPADECPECGHDLVEADRCEVCGEWKSNEDYMCEECDKEWFTVENAYAAAEACDDLTEVKINAFAVELLGDEGIRDAIAEAVKNVVEDRYAKEKIHEYATGCDPLGFVDAVLAGKKGEKV